MLSSLWSWTLNRLAQQVWRTAECRMDLGPTRSPATFRWKFVLAIWAHFRHLFSRKTFTRCRFNTWKFAILKFVLQIQFRLNNMNRNTIDIDTEILVHRICPKMFSRPNYIARMIVIYSAKFKQECFCCLGVEKLKRSNKKWKRERSTYHNDSTRFCRFC